MNKGFLSTVLLATTCQLMATAASADWMSAASDVLSGEKTTGEASAAAATDFAKGLLPALTDSLGVSAAQAEGGMGSLFALAQENLSKGDFSELSNSVPNMDQMLSAAPEVQQSSGGDSSALTSMLGGSDSDYGKAMAGAQDVYKQFSQLGLEGGQIGDYVTVTTNFLQSEGGQSAVDIFKKGLGSLAGG